MDGPDAQARGDGAARDVLVAQHVQLGLAARHQGRRAEARVAHHARVPLVAARRARGAVPNRQAKAAGREQVGRRLQQMVLARAQDEELEGDGDRRVVQLGQRGAVGAQVVYLLRVRVRVRVRATLRVRVTLG